MDAKGLSVRLFKRFGLGELPIARRRLYARLEREVVTHGEAPWEIITTVAQEADQARDKGKYFCWVVVRRLKENGFMRNEAAGASAADSRRAVSDLAREVADRADANRLDRLA